MGKETFDRSKPHVNIGTVGTDELEKKASELIVVHSKLQNFLKKQNEIIKTQQTAIHGMRDLLSKLRLTAQPREVGMINKALGIEKEEDNLNKMLGNSVSKKTKDLLKSSGVEVVSNPNKPFKL